MSSKAVFDDRALGDLGTLGRVIERFWNRNVSRGTTIKRGMREKFDHARREISVDLHCSVLFGEFAVNLNEKKDHFQILFDTSLHFRDGLINLQLSPTTSIVLIQHRSFQSSDLLF